MLSIIANEYVKNSSKSPDKGCEEKTKTSRGVARICEENDKETYRFQEFALGSAPRS